MWKISKIKVIVTLAWKKSGLYKIQSQPLQQYIKHNKCKEKNKTISNFDFSAFHTTILCNLSIKVLSETVRFLSKSGTECGFLQHLYIGHLKVIGKDISLKQL